MDQIGQPDSEEIRQTSPNADLTPREREVCRLIGLGHTNVDISRCLEISTKTVESHRKNLMAKLGLRSRAEVVRFALSHGLVERYPAGAIFRYCPTCLTKWDFRGAFLSDPEVKFEGYESFDGGRPAGVMLFKHRCCGTNLPCPLEWFQEMTGQSILGDSCAVRARPDYCLSQSHACPCPLRCVCTFVWLITRIIREWPKHKPVTVTACHYLFFELTRLGIWILECA